MKDTLPDSRELIDGIVAFIDREVSPLEDEISTVLGDPRQYWREDGRVDDRVVGARRIVRERSAEAGYYTAFLPERLGGANLGATRYLQTWQALWRRHGPPVHRLPYWALAHPATGPSRIWEHASQELVRDVLPRLTSGELQGAFAMSEANAGSDAWMMTTRAVRDGDTWSITGQKQWASWAPTADFVIVFAVTDPTAFAAHRGGLTAFYVPTTSPGYRCESVIKLFGELGGEECILSFEDVRVPDARRIGPVDGAFAIALEGADYISLTKAGQMIGIAHWAIERATSYARTRITFGKSLADHEVVQRMLAECCVQLYACKTMALDCAARLDRGEDVRSEMVLSQSFMFEATHKIVDQAIQVHGGMGLANELDLIDGWHWSRVARITEGPTEIQLRSVANLLFKNRLRL